MFESVAAFARQRMPRVGLGAIVLVILCDRSKLTSEVVAKRSGFHQLIMDAMEETMIPT